MANHQSCFLVRVLTCGFLLVSMAAAWVAPTAALAVDLAFPSPTSFSGGPTGLGPLGAGGGGHHFIAGDDLTQTFLGTGLPSVTQSRWQFTMDDYTSVGVQNLFDIQINGITVGSFSFTGDGQTSTLIPFDLTFNHAAIAGPDYTLRMVATSTVPPGLASWNWVAGGTVTLVPEPASAALLALAGLGLLRRRQPLA